MNTEMSTSNSYEPWDNDSNGKCHNLEYSRNQIKPDQRAPYIQDRYHIIVRHNMEKKRHGDRNEIRCDIYYSWNSTNKVLVLH